MQAESAALSLRVLETTRSSKACRTKWTGSIILQVRKLRVRE